MMQAAYVRAKAEMRRRIGAAVMLAILLGAFAGIAAAAVAGGRRTATVHPRFMAEQQTFDTFVGDFSLFVPDLFWKPDFEWIARLPYVKRAVLTTYYFGEGADISAVHDPKFGRDYAKTRLLSGRLADPAHPEEIVVPFASEHRAEARIGSTLDLQFHGPQGPVDVSLRVVGLVAGPGHFPPADFVGNDIVATPAFNEKYGQRLLSTKGAYIWLDRGFDDIPRLKRDLATQTGGKLYSLFDMRDQARNVERSFILEATALWFVGAFLGIAVALVFAPAVARHVTADADEHSTLRALGMRRADLRAVAAIRVTFILLPASLVALIAMAALSPIFPRGVARVAEVDPGVQVDLVAFALAWFPIMLLIALLVSVSVVRLASWIDATVQGRVRPSLTATIFARAGLSPAALSGARLALEPGAGRTAIPVRSTLTAAVLSIVAIFAAFTFGASLQHLLDTPRLYGKHWHISYGFGDPMGPQKNLEIARTDREVAAAEIGANGIPIEVDGIATNALLVAGDSFTTVARPILEGTLPGAREVVLGPRIIKAIGKEVGDTVLVGPPGTNQARARIAGVAVLPPMSETMQLGEGVLMRYEATQEMLPQAPPPDELFVRFRDGLDPVAASERLRKKLIEPDQDFTTQSPQDLLNLGRVDRLPGLLAALLGVLSFAIVGHLMIASIRRRRRDLAVLKTIGFVRGQVVRTVAWQASILVVTAIVCAIPLGLALGRWLWSLLAVQLGVLGEPVLDVRSALLALPIGLVVANLVALLPARAAARTQPAAVLRAE